MMPTSSTQWIADRMNAIVSGVDALAWEMEGRWGVGRLRLLVSDEVRERFDRQQRHWFDAMWPPDGSVPDLATIERVGEAMKRAWVALDGLASQAGHAPIDPEVWETPLPDGRVLAVVKTCAEAHRVARDGRGVVVWTMEEVARIAASSRLIDAAKTEFPECRIIEVRDPTGSQDGFDPAVGDEITI